MKVSMENDNNFGYEKITIVVDNIPLRHFFYKKKTNLTVITNEGVISPGIPLDKMLDITTGERLI